MWNPFVGLGQAGRPLSAALKNAISIQKGWTDVKIHGAAWIQVFERNAAMKTEGMHP